MSNFVQAIAVTPGTHFETVGAVAIAAAVAAGEQRSHAEAWQSWLGASFTKSVRRVRRPADIAELSDDPMLAAVHACGSARAFAFVPMPYPQFPPRLRRLQVSGLDIDRALDLRLRAWESVPRADTPEVLINQDLQMSTGKTAAQVAHALVARTLDLAPSDLTRWIADPAVRLRVTDLDEIAVQHSITIRDNGLTEIEPGTATVRIARP